MSSSRYDLDLNSAFLTQLTFAVGALQTITAPAPVVETVAPWRQPFAGPQRATADERQLAASSSSDGDSNGAVEPHGRRSVGLRQWSSARRDDRQAAIARAEEDGDSSSSLGLSSIEDAVSQKLRIARQNRSDEDSFRAVSVSVHTSP